MLALLHEILAALGNGPLGALEAFLVFLQLLHPLLEIEKGIAVLPDFEYFQALALVGNVANAHAALLEMRRFVASLALGLFANELLHNAAELDLLSVVLLALRLEMQI